MKKRGKDTCALCGRPLNIILRDKNGTEKLCLKCLVAHYPTLRELSKVV